MALRILRHDITQIEADAIVNTANPRPLIGSGTEAAIYEAAGKDKLLARRREIGNIHCGQAVWTEAFGLKAKYIIHAASPSWEGGKKGEAALLRQTYDAALNLAKELHCRSIAFPLLASGNYGFPQDIALSTAIGAFTDFLMEQELQIDLVLFNREAFHLAGSLFDDLKSYIDDNYVSEKLRKEYLPTHLSETVNDYSEGWRRENTSFAASVSFSDGAPSASLEDYLNQHEITFSQHLLDLLREREGKDSEVYKRAEVSKQLFSKIISNPNYQPTKSTAIQLAIGLELDLPMTQKLLGRAGYALTRSNKTDLVVQYYIEKKIYSIPFINAALYDCGLPLLKTGLKT